MAPKVASPKTASPNADSPKAASPKADSPKAASPKASRKAASPKVSRKAASPKAQSDEEPEVLGFMEAVTAYRAAVARAGAGFPDSATTASHFKMEVDRCALECEAAYRREHAEVTNIYDAEVAAQESVLERKLTLVELHAAMGKVLSDLSARRGELPTEQFIFYSRVISAHMTSKKDDGIDLKQMAATALAAFSTLKIGGGAKGNLARSGGTTLFRMTRPQLESLSKGVHKALKVDGGAVVSRELLTSAIKKTVKIDKENALTLKYLKDKSSEAVLYCTATGFLYTYAGNIVKFCKDPEAYGEEDPLIGATVAAVGSSATAIGTAATTVGTSLADIGTTVQSKTAIGIATTTVGKSVAAIGKAVKSKAGKALRDDALSQRELPEGWVFFL